MKRYPLHTLLRLREHRTDAARMLVLERQRAVQACREACTRIEGEIRDLQQERSNQRGRLLDAPPPGVAWPTALAQRESHIEWLGLQVVAAQQRLAQAQQKLREAEKALDDARDAFFRAKARQEALEKRKDAWRGEQRALESRIEEAATEDLWFARRTQAGD
jgi:predicted  nucleic acid-binding Zn-ribbon protein